MIVIKVKQVSYLLAHVTPREQELSNLLHDKDYIKAVAMAINLD